MLCPVMRVVIYLVYNFKVSPDGLCIALIDSPVLKLPPAAPLDHLGRENRLVRTQLSKQVHSYSIPATFSGFPVAFGGFQAIPCVFGHLRLKAKLTLATQFDLVGITERMSEGAWEHLFQKGFRREVFCPFPLIKPPHPPITTIPPLCYILVLLWGN